MKERSVCGSYAGATPWEIFDDRDSKELAHSLAQSTGCAYYTVDGVCFGPFRLVNDGRSPEHWTYGERNRAARIEHEYTKDMFS